MHSVFMPPAMVLRPMPDPGVFFDWCFSCVSGAARSGHKRATILLKITQAGLFGYCLKQRYTLPVHRCSPLP